MGKHHFIIAAAVSCFAFTSETASADTWSCAVKDKIAGAQIKQYRIDGKILKDLTDDKISRMWMPDTKDFLGTQYDILLNTKDALIAESDYTGLNSLRIKEIYVINIIISKSTGNLVESRILLHLPDPNEIETRYGSCTFDK